MPAAENIAIPGPPDRSLIRWGLAVLGVLVLLLAGLWVLGVLSFDAAEPKEKLVAAVTIVGGFLTGSLTFLGLVFKDSIDRRSLAIQTQAEARARDAEGRQKVEAAVNTIGLLGTKDGTEPPESLRTGVILLLQDLGRMHLALSLVYQMLPTGKLHPNAASWFLNDAMKSEDADVSQQAAVVLENVAGFMTSPDGNASFPAVFWSPDFWKLSPAVRWSGIQALLNLIIKKPFPQWKRDIAKSIVEALATIRLEMSAHPVSAAQSFEGELELSLYRLLGPFAGEDILINGQYVSATEERAKLVGWKDVVSTYSSRADALRNWTTPVAAAAEGESAQAGAFNAATPRAS